MQTSSNVSLWWLALVAGLLPLLTIHTTYLISAVQGHVDWCVPYWDSCTSISRTGRHGFSYYLFKGTMLPAAVLGILFWWLNARWLRALGAQNPGVAWLPWLGLVACVSLAAYTMALGHGGGGFNVTRRTGVVLYFALTFLSQLLLSASLYRTPGWTREGRRLIRWCQGTLAIGIFSVILSGVAYDYYSQVDDAFEWVLAVMINAHALWVALLWRKSGFQARLETG